MKERWGSEHKDRLHSPKVLKQRTAKRLSAVIIKWCRINPIPSHQGCVFRILFYSQSITKKEYSFPFGFCSRFYQIMLQKWNYFKGWRRRPRTNIGCQFQERIPVTQENLGVSDGSSHSMEQIFSQFSKGLAGQKFITFFKVSEGQLIINEGN